MTSGEQWAIITVAYNSADKLKKYWKGNILPDDVQWIVVDNASKDESIAVSKELGAQVFGLRRNTGFALANNIGLALCNAPYVAFINPDVRVRFEDLPALRNIVDQTSGLVAPQLLNNDGSIQFNARGLPFLIDQLAHRGLRLPTSNLSEYLPTYAEDVSTVPVAWATGAVIASKTSIFKGLYGWDRRYFLYYEDVDLCMRAWHSGIPVCLTTSVRWNHGWARDSARPTSLAFRQQLRSATKFYRRYPGLLDPTRRVAYGSYQRLSVGEVQV